MYLIANCFFFSLEFPVQFQLIEDLKGLIEKAHKLDHDVEKLLLLPSIEEADLERLNEEVCNHLYLFFFF